MLPKTQALSDCLTEHTHSELLNNYSLDVFHFHNVKPIHSSLVINQLMKFTEVHWETEVGKHLQFCRATVQCASLTEAPRLCVLLAPGVTSSSAETQEGQRKPGL